MRVRWVRKEEGLKIKEIMCQNKRNERGIFKG